jgi:hypothetical protein
VRLLSLMRLGSSVAPMRPVPSIWPVRPVPPGLRVWPALVAPPPPPPLLLVPTVPMV